MIETLIPDINNLKKKKKKEREISRKDICKSVKGREKKL